MTERIYRFGEFTVSAPARELCAGGAPVELAARAFDCLVYLIEHRERAVGRDELIAAVWGRADVSEALLNHTILKIRRVLGGSGQAPIRTVPRFGYRWVGPLDGEAVGDVLATTHDAGVVERPTATSGKLAAASAPIRPRASRATALVAIALTAVAAVAIVAALRWHRAPVAPVTDDAAVEPSTPALPALVLPAKVEAPDDWAWLRFGVMDLVANRLRAGQVRTTPSESVVAILKQRATSDGDALLVDPSLAPIAALRVLPRVRFDGTTWSVALDAVGTQQRVLADATSTDPIVAARDATDRLLVKLGRSPAAIAAKELSPARDDLLQRTGAAMLADQLDAARAMIDDAAPDLRAAPEMQQRIAQIELRGGEYDAVEQRLVALIDTLDPKRDASLRARALITLASSYVRRNRFDKASEAYEEAIALRNDARDPEVLGMAHLGRGIGLAQSGKFDEAADELGRARIELETSGDALGIAQVYVNLGDFQVMRNRPADALPMLRNAEKRFAELGAREGAVYTGTSIAAVERALLDPAAALATTDRFWPPEAHTSNPRMQWRAVRSRIEALVANGRLGDADALIARARRESDPTRDAALRAQVDAIAAAVAWLRGSEADAAKLAAAAETQTLRNGDAALYAANLALLADALRARGDVAGAGEATKRLRAFADEEHDARVTLEASIAEAAQAWATDRRDAALAGYAAALKSAEALNVPDALVAAGAPYIAALIGASHLDDARSVSSRVAPWADRDLRAATAQALLFRALDRADAARNAEAQAKRLAGDGALPKALAESVSGSR